MIQTAAAAPADSGMTQVVLQVDGETLGRIVYDNYFKGSLQPMVEAG